MYIFHVKMLTGMNWFAGAKYCYYQNAMLAQIPDSATQTFLEYHAADGHDGNPEFWLGANDIFIVSYYTLLRKFKKLYFLQATEAPD